jgi:hypothetical protein
MNIRARACLLVLLSAALVACKGSGPPSSAPSVTAALTFNALWWSQAQMENLNPNSPPPKTQVVELERWEYTDPVGVPHPDKVDILATISTPANATPVQAVVQIMARWKIGPESDREKAAWEPASFLDAVQSFALQPGETRQASTPVDLAKQMEVLGKTEQWPWALSATAVIRNSATGEIIASVSKEMPILRGD